MSFRITGLPAESFAPFFAMDEATLRRHGARRLRADGPGYPCRISLTDAAPGDSLILVNFEHHDADTPFRARHAVYVREGETRFEARDEIPEQLRKRLLSVRGYDSEGMMLRADVVEGREAEPMIADFLADPAIAYLHLHYARQGCYAARVDRA